MVFNLFRLIIPFIESPHLYSVSFCSSKNLLRRFTSARFLLQQRQISAANAPVYHETYSPPFPSAVCLTKYTSFCISTKHKGISSIPGETNEIFLSFRPHTGKAKSSDSRGYKWFLAQVKNCRITFSMHIAAGPHVNNDQKFRGGVKYGGSAAVPDRKQFCEPFRILLGIRKYLHGSKIQQLLTGW